MKEVKVAKERQQQLILEAAERLMRYQELLDTYTKGGNEMIEKQVTFQRAELYREIWAISLSKVAAKYQVPASKLKEACEKANIPLPTNKYWGDLSVGKPVTPIPLPDFSLTVEAIGITVPRILNIIIFINIFSNIDEFIIITKHPY